jgi:hypothetical protein
MEYTVVLTPNNRVAVLLSSQEYPSTLMFSGRMAQVKSHEPVK